MWQQCIYYIKILDRNIFIIYIWWPGNFSYYAYVLKLEFQHNIAKYCKEKIDFLHGFVWTYDAYATTFLSTTPLAPRLALKLSLSWSFYLFYHYCFVNFYFSWLLYSKSDFTGSLSYGSWFSSTWNLGSLLDLN